MGNTVPHQSCRPQPSMSLSEKPRLDLAGPLPIQCRTTIFFFVLLITIVVKHACVIC